MGWTRREVLMAGAAGAAILAAGEGQTRAEAGGPRFKLGTVTYNVAKDWDLPTLLHNVKAGGLEGVELRTGHAHGVELALTPAQRREVKARFADSGVTLWGLGTTCEYQSPDPATVARNIEETRRWCELAEELGAHGVKVRPNGLPKEVEVAKTLEQIGKSLNSCGDAAAAHGVEIFLEVHGSGTMEPQNARTILDHCRHPKVGACWNSNATDVSGGSVKAAFELLRPDIRSCHITELWNTGYPYRELFRLFRESGYDRFTLCEIGASVRAEDGVVFLQAYHGLWRELCRA